MTMQRHMKLARNADAATLSISQDFTLSSDNVVSRKEWELPEPEVDPRTWTGG